MVVPYGDPSPVRSWQNYFDTGEYLVGQYANSLELGCDCLGEITYLAPSSPTPSATRGRSATASACTRRTGRHPGQAHRPVDRHQLHPPQPPPGDLLLHHHRQLRLRLLLVPLPRRHHRVRGQGHRRRLHQRLPGRAATRTPRRWPPAWARRTTSTCSAPAWTWRSTASPNRVEEEDVVRRAASGEGNERGNAFSRKRTVLRPRIRGRPRGRHARTAGPGCISNPESTQPPGRARGLQAAPAGPAHPAGRPRVLDRPARRLCHQGPVGHPLRRGRALPDGRLREPACRRRRAAGVRRRRTATWTARTSCSGTPSA